MHWDGRRLLLTILVVAVAGLIAGACGKSGDSDPAPAASLAEPGDARAVATAVRELQSAFADGDVATICSRLTRAAQLQAGRAVHSSPSRCDVDVRRRLAEIRQGTGWGHVGEPQVVEVEVAGDRATATIARDVRRRTELPMARERGRWKLDSFFGTAPARAREFAAEVTDGAFPATEGAGVRVSDVRGDPCPALSERRFPDLAGGCRISASSETAVPLHVSTVFGEFILSDCVIEHEARVDERGRTWTERLAFEREPGGPFNACGDVYQCVEDPDATTFDDVPTLPLRGRIRVNGDASYTHHVNVCLDTCIGYFVGELVIDMAQDGGTLRAELAGAAVGDSGFWLDAPLELERGGLRLEATGGDSAAVEADA